MTEVELLRYNPHIDPHLHVWGWEVPVYLFLGGLTAGVMILTAALAGRIPREERSRWLRWMPFAGPIAISLGMGALFLDLEHQTHVWRFYLSFQVDSPMSWGAWILNLIYPATVLFGLANLTDDELDRVTALPVFSALSAPIGWLRRWSVEHVDGLRYANIALGVLLGGYTGVLLGTLGARAAWSSSMLGPLFLVSGFSTGAALMMLFPLRDKEHHALQRWDMIAIAVEIALIVLFFLGLSTGSEASREAARMFLGGSYTAPFWALVVLAGLATPLLLEGVELRRKLRPTRLAPVLILVGGFALRAILVSAGQA